MFQEVQVFDLGFRHTSFRELLEYLVESSIHPLHIWRLPWERSRLPERTIICLKVIMKDMGAYKTRRGRRNRRAELGEMPLRTGSGGEPRGERLPGGRGGLQH